MDFIEDQLVGNFPGHAFQAWYRHEYFTNY